MFYIYVTNSKVTGAGVSYNDNIPEQCVICTEDQYNYWQYLSLNSDGTLYIDEDKKLAAEKDLVIAEAKERISKCLALATEKIAPLQDATDLGMATEEESASLIAWKTFRVLMSRVESKAGFPENIDWPVQPA